MGNELAADTRASEVKAGGGHGKDFAVREQCVMPGSEPPS